MGTPAYAIETLWIRIQAEFLDHPGVTLSEEDLRRRFRSNDQIRAAVLAALVESGVLARTTSGGYRLAAPHAFALAPHAA